MRTLLIDATIALIVSISILIGCAITLAWL